MYRILSSVPFLGLLVLPLLAQEEALHGTWEGRFVDEEGNHATMRLTFKPGGAFELDQEITLGEAFQSVVSPRPDSNRQLGGSVDPCSIQLSCGGSMGGVVDPAHPAAGL